MIHFLENALFKVAAYVLFRQIIAFNKKWTGKTDNMHGKYACDINGQPYVMSYTLKKGEKITFEELERMTAPPEEENSTN